MITEKHLGYGCMWFVGVSLTSFFGMVVYALITQHKTIDNPRYTVGTCIDYEGRGSKGSRSARFEYYVKGKRYIEEGGSPSYFIVGDKFILCYDFEEPEVADVMEMKPVFIKGEETGKSVGYITHYTGGKLFDVQVTFKYAVGQYLYERSMTFPEDYRFKGIEKGNLYEVTYWKNDPRRSIINLEVKGSSIPWNPEDYD
ncbi:hypothetical protein [Desertivirga brevis]|uniref:hypothetical protein n=1 Tax=Desertivirga brevis TaxID=2810310 RepID=UPI001A96E5D7|nr:hypothetical protein [Pedobacter sp. SYSU D00873]